MALAELTPPDSPVYGTLKGSEQLRPRFFISRGNGICVPLVAVDELPQGPSASSHRLYNNRTIPCSRCLRPSTRESPLNPKYFKPWNPKDGQLMCFAGLWDCAKFEGAEDKLYTYTVITTDSNKQLKFLHDRMPVILDNGSEEIRTWLDPKRAEWSRELQSLLKPYDGELECYPVSKDVGKVGNNSPSFIVPIDSTENKNNIANFFGNQKKAAKIQEERLNVKKEDEGDKGEDVKAEQREDTRKTEDHDGTEDNAPFPVPEDTERAVAGIKREHTEAEDSDDATDQASPRKAQKTTANQPSPEKAPKTIRRTRNATSNSPLTKKASPKVASDGSKKITNFFNK
ncbi:hypothetical protein B0A49_10642 [Cryomyces minteri]|uniref:DUF159 domain protein n=1 Tax=Cryomyces minteri TaxID=331657 RepID=A0A4U0WHU4_9PEZI|nr:hypothetical protein B0A49_10642 [Cryomyces minteri]